MQCIIHWSYQEITQKTLKQHYYKGSIQKHYQLNHNQKITKEELYNNTKIMEHKNGYKRLIIIKEALEMLDKLPAINTQDKNFPNILKLYKNINIISRNQEQNSNMLNNNVQNQTQITSQIIGQS